MQAPSIRVGGGDPTADGQINLYHSAEGQAQSWYNTAKRVIFVNGMDNSPQDHAGSARSLSLLQGCPIIGVFNRSDGKAADVAQCIADKVRFSNIQASSRQGFEGWVQTVDQLYQAAKQKSPALTKVDYVGSLIKGNAATYALYALLVGAGGVNAKTTPIHAHSQGNLITSNALTAVALAKGTAAIAGMEVHSFGSPARDWPPGLARVNNAFTLDLVTMMDLRVDMSSSKVGFVAGHNFKLYMQRDAEFIVNRYRFGGLNMTLNMDEQGLAAALVRMGSNAPRIRRIFIRLREVHWSDSDDVAVHYVEKAPVALLRSIKQVDPGLIQILINLLSAGVPFPDENRAIAKLKAL